MRSIVARPPSWCHGSAALAIAFLAACGDGSQAPPIDAPPTPTTLTFRLSYRSDVPDSIYVQSGTELGGQGWLTVRTLAGVDLTILDDCGVCNCDSCDPCAVCGAGRPEVTEIPRDGHLDWTWDTRVFGPGTCAGTGGTCEASTAIAPGPYLARFCWSTTTDGVGPGHHVGALTCAEEPFDVAPAGPPPAPVEHEECACG